MITIAHVITGLELGGAETMLYKLITNTDKEKFHHIVISLTSEGHYGKIIKYNGIPVYTLNLKRPSKLLLTPFRYRKILKRHQIDVVQAWMYHANVFATLLSFLWPKAKIIHNVRQSLEKLSNNKIKTQITIKLNALLSRLSYRVINNSLSSQRQHRAIGFSKKNELHIPNGFEENIFQPNQTQYKNIRQEHNIPKDAKIIGMLARYNVLKNQAGFLNVAQCLLSQKPNDLHFFLAGRGCGHQNKALRKKIEDLGLIQHITLLDQVAPQEYLPAFDVYLSTSIEEGFPNVIGEAMLCGVPCVATNVGDCQTIIGDYGFISDIDDIEGLAQGCLKALETAQETKEAMRQEIAKRYSIKAVAHTYEMLYTSALNETQKD